MRGTQFNPPDSEGNVEIEVPNDRTPEGRKEFSVSLNRSYIRPVDGYGAHVSAEGGDIRIIVYDNDCKCYTYQLMCTYY